jgi:hypothetical protein
MHNFSRSVFGNFNFIGKYFDSGWAFFLPYLFFYLVFWAWGLPVPSLTKIFYFFHGLHAFGLICLICSRFPFEAPKKFLFWLALAIIFFIVGAHLEFPSDTWTHFRRIFEWQHLQLIEESSSKHKFAYFLGHSFLGWIEPINRRFATDLYSSVCLLLLAFQTYKLAKILGLNENWARLGVLSSIFFLGYDNIGFYLYHGISSSQISLLASFAAIRITLKLASKPKVSTFLLVFTTVSLSGLNHIQGVLIWSVATLGILIASVISKFGWKQGGGGCLAFLVFAGIFCSPLASNFIEKSPTLPYFEANKWILPWGGINPFGQDYLFRTLGLFGTLNVFAGFCILNKKSMLGWITIAAPTLLILSPIGLALISLLMEESNPVNYHRVLYGTLPLFSILFLLQQGCRKYKYNDCSVAPVVGITLVFFSIFHHAPILGKTWGFLARPTHAQRLTPIDDTVQWLHRNVPIHKDKYFLSDVATEYAVSSHLGTISSPGLERRIPENLHSRLKELGGARGILKEREIAGVLTLAIQPQIDPAGSSRGKTSGHWDSQTIPKNLFFVPTLEDELQELIDHGWSKTKVPPWYVLYLRPEQLP